MSRCDDVSFEAIADVAESAYPGLGEALRDVKTIGVPWSLSLYELLTRTPPAYIAWSIGKREEYNVSPVSGGRLSRQLP